MYDIKGLGKWILVTNVKQCIIELTVHKKNIDYATDEYCKFGRIVKRKMGTFESY